MLSNFVGPVDFNAALVLAAATPARASSSLR